MNAPSKVRVELRIKPTPDDILDLTLPHRVSLAQRSFTFDYIYPSTANHDDIFRISIQELLDKFISSFNCTVFAYGQTGSGKTYTMGISLEALDEYNERKLCSNEKDVNGCFDDQLFLGIVPDSIDYIFKHVKPADSIFCTFIEVYNEEVIDLLSGFRTPLNLRCSNGETNISGSKEVKLDNVSEAIKTLRRGLLERTVKSTKMNLLSSRSHAIFTLIMHKNQNDKTLVSKFTFVDLAGSERMKRTEAVGQTARESISINGGLLALSNVITALSKKCTFVPYRDSKLTRILQHGLGGNSHTLMLACISGSSKDVAETFNTLKYAHRATNICNDVKKGVEIDIGRMSVIDLKKAIQRLKTENEGLKKKMRSRDGDERMNDVVEENGKLKEELRSVRRSNKNVEGSERRRSEEMKVGYENEIKRLGDENRKMKNCVDGLNKEIERLKNTIHELNINNKNNINNVMNMCRCGSDKENLSQNMSSKKSNIPNPFSNENPFSNNKIHANVNKTDINTDDKRIQYQTNICENNYQHLDSEKVNYKSEHYNSNLVFSPMPKDKSVNNRSAYGKLLSNEIMKEKAVQAINKKSVLARHKDKSSEHDKIITSESPLGFDLKKAVTRPVKILFDEQINMPATPMKHPKYTSIMINDSPKKHKRMVTFNTDNNCIRKYENIIQSSPLPTGDSNENSIFNGTTYKTYMNNGNLVFNSKKLLSSIFTNSKDGNVTNPDSKNIVDNGNVNLSLYNTNGIQDNNVNKVTNQEFQFGWGSNIVDNNIRNQNLTGFDMINTGNKIGTNDVSNNVRSVTMDNKGHVLDKQPIKMNIGNGDGMDNVMANQNSTNLSNLNSGSIGNNFINNDNVTNCANTQPSCYENTIENISLYNTAPNNKKDFHQNIDNYGIEYNNDTIPHRSTLHFIRRINIPSPIVSIICLFNYIYTSTNSGYIYKIDVDTYNVEMIISENGKIGKILRYRDIFIYTHRNTIKLCNNKETIQIIVTHEEISTISLKKDYIIVGTINGYLQIYDIKEICGIRNANNDVIFNFDILKKHCKIQEMKKTLLYESRDVCIKEQIENKTNNCMCGFGCIYTSKVSDCAVLCISNVLETIYASSADNTIKYIGKRTTGILESKHTGNVRSSLCFGDKFLISMGDDRSICVFDDRTQIGYLADAHISGIRSSVMGSAFNFYTGGDDGVVKLWALRRSNRNMDDNIGMDDNVDMDDNIVMDNCIVVLKDQIVVDGVVNCMDGNEEYLYVGCGDQSIVVLRK